MKKHVKKEGNYPFIWLDDLVENILNPEIHSVADLEKLDLDKLVMRIPEEFRAIKTRLKSQAFTLYSEKHLRVVAGQYDQAIRLIGKQVQIILAQMPSSGSLRDTVALLLGHIHGLEEAINQRFPSYLLGEKIDTKRLSSNLKVMCRLSVDQIAIILKAADELGVVAARSFSEVLRSIIPFLSTERFENVSWKSARSSVYKIEHGDREKAIETLGMLIKRIKEF